MSDELTLEPGRCASFAESGSPQNVSTVTNCAAVKAAIGA